MNETAKPSGQRIGELATTSGLTVRTLHYYEEIGLLTPSERTTAGHRVYHAPEIDRLYRILLLRRLGLSLEQVTSVLDDPTWDINTTLAAHLKSVEERLERGRRLRSRLTRLLEATADQQPSTTDLIEIVEEIAMTDTTSGVRERISILVYADLEEAAEYLRDVFGFGQPSVHRDPDGSPALVTVEAGDGVLWLHRESPDFEMASPQSLGATTSMMAIMVDDVDAHFERAKASGATIVYEPVDQPYGYREYSARDLEGGLWSFMKPLT